LQPGRATCYKLRVDFLADMAWGEALRAAASSSLASTLAAFGLILLLTRLRVPLSLGILAGAVTLGLLDGQSVGEVLRRAGLGAVQPGTIGLLVVVVLMLALSEAMRRAGQLDEIVSLAGGFLRRPAVAMAALPALIGLMPMPGGAQLSAPMVDAASGGARVSPERLSAINYWFRHIWEHFWPLYPGVIVAMSLTGSDVGAFVLHQFPLGIFMAASGLLIFRGSHPDLHRTASRAAAGQGRRLLRATSTIWIILLVWAAVRGAMAYLGDLPARGGAWGAVGRYAPLAVALAVSLTWTVRMNRLGRAQLLAIARHRPIYKLAGIVVCVMVFWYTIHQAGSAGRIADELAALHVPGEVVVALLPLIAGLVTGLAVGFVGTSFPIALAVIAARGDAGSIRPYVALAYAFGHIGQMLSPLHVCQVVSNEYFGARPRGVYRRLIPSIAITAACAVAYFLFLRWVLA